MRPEIQDVVEKVRAYSRQFEDGSIRLADLDQLSNIATRLSAYKVYLGEYVAELERAADLAEAHHELTREQAYKAAKDEKKTDGAADNIKRLAGIETKQKHIEAKYNYKMVANLHRDTDNLIDTLRSRLSYKKSEMRGDG